MGKNFDPDDFNMQMRAIIGNAISDPEFMAIAVFKLFFPKEYEDMLKALMERAAKSGTIGGLDMFNYAQTSLGILPGYEATNHAPSEAFADLTKAILRKALVDKPIIELLH